MLRMGLDETLGRLKRAVLAGGGQWVGIQAPLEPLSPSLLMFTSPTTGSTLAVPFASSILVTDEFSDTDISEAVHKRIEESDQKFANRLVSVKATRLKEISDLLLNLSQELDDLYFRRK